MRGMSEDRNTNEEYGLLGPGTIRSGGKLPSLLRNILYMIRLFVVLSACIDILIVI
jgi:hypothetical protein